MKHQKTVLSGLAVIVATIGIITVMNNDTPTKNSEIPVTAVKPAAAAQAQATPKTTESVTTPAILKKTGTSQSVTTNETPIEAPKVYFSASSDQYPGSGTFMLPNFTTDPNWSVTFNYTCDTGQVFGVINLGAQNIFMNRTGTFGGFVSTAGQIKIVVPDSQNCTWDILVS